MADQENIFGDYISVYTRKQAIEDGVLIDVSNMARTAGITFPVAITAALWSDYVIPTEPGTDENGRLWDLLNVFRFAARASKPGESEIRFKVLFVMGGGKQETIELKALCHPGDNMEPVITIMLPEED